MGKLLCILVLFIIILSPRRLAEASALATPPTSVRMVIFNAIDGANLTSVAVTVKLTALGSPAGSPTKSILVGNDAAPDASGNSDLLIDFSGATAGVPTNGTAGSTTLRVFPGKEYNIDGQYSTLSMRSRSSGIPVHVFASY